MKHFSQKHLKKLFTIIVAECNNFYPTVLGIAWVIDVGVELKSWTVSSRFYQLKMFDLMSIDTVWDRV